jgi:predicted aspartyl protease
MYWCENPAGRKNDQLIFVKVTLQYIRTGIFIRKACTFATSSLHAIIMRQAARYHFIFLSFLLVTTTATAQKNTADMVFNTALNELLHQKEYFKLEIKYRLLKNDLEKAQQLYFGCFIDNAFNRNEAAITGIDIFLKQHEASIPDSVKAALLLLQADSYYKLFQYTKAGFNDSIVIASYSTAIDSTLLRRVRNDLLTANILKDIPPQQTQVNNGTVLTWKKDRMGLTSIPVQVAHQTINSVFDTRANISCITETYARKLGLHLMDGTVEDGSGITGIRFQNQLGIADSLYIGDILFTHVVFLVMPDDKLRFGLFFSINLIIGFPVIEQMKEIQLYKDGRMIVPAMASTGGEHNLAIDGPDPILYLQSGNDSLCFQLDLGAQQTSLYATYFERYATNIIANGKKTTVKLGGAGGSKRKDIYLIPQLSLSIANKNIILRKVNVFTQKLSPQERFYGNLGQDFINNFDKLVLNFKAMSFEVE